jgi:hypothetical protein
MKQQLKEIILENQQFKVGIINKRKHLHIPTNAGMIISVVGARRSGKTYMLYDLIEQIKRDGIESTKIVFINFEDERLNLKQTDLDLILQAYMELYPNAMLAETYFFFDEIQNVEGWEKFIRRVYDTKSKNLFITGSNSRLLSTEIATELRGRTVSYTIYPYSFAEFVEIQKGPHNHHTQANRAKLINLSEQYLAEGGFPELLRFDRSFKTKVLQEYFNVMIYRDIIERYSVSNPEVLKFFIKKIFSSVTGPLSVNKTYNDLKSLGYKVSNKYLYEYLDYCNTVFLTQSICKYDFSEIKQAKSDKKTYIIDNGLLSAIDFSVSKNRGKLLENMVAMELLKQGNSLFYYKDKTECNFIVQQKNSPTISPIQVSITIKQATTRVRELKGLVDACKYLKVDEGTIITMDEEETIETDSIKINVVPFYKYFMNLRT